MTNYYYLFYISIILIVIYLIINNNIKIHPIYLILIILIYTIIISLILSIWRFNFIYSIILFLIIIRGLLIIFLYFSRLISNEQNNINLSPLILTPFLINSFALYYLLINSPSLSFLKFTIYYSSENNILFNNPNNPFHNISIIYIYPYINLTLLRIFYLLITLFTTIKICSIKSFSLRKIS